MKKQWAPPTHWQDFEELCYRLFTAEYNSKQSYKYGRAGQEQNGVDIALLPKDGSNWHSIQCKVKDDLLKSKLRPSDVRDEYIKSKKFKHTIEKFIIATTAMPDNKPQDEAMRLTSHFTSDYSIEIKFWTDIESLLEKHNGIAKIFYPERFADEKSITSNSFGSVAIAMGPDDWRERLEIFFKSAEFQSAARSHGDAIRTVLAELIDNCITQTKGNAQTVRLMLSGEMIRIEDDGIPFDIIENDVKLNERMQGIRAIRRILERDKGLSYGYCPADLQRTRFNKTELAISPTLTQPVEPRCWASAPTTFLMDRDMGTIFVKNLVIAENCDEFVLTLYKGHFFSASSRDAVVLALLDRLNGIPLRIKVSRDCGDAFNEMIFHANDYEGVIFEEI
jgi:hypothetical protein